LGKQIENVWFYELFWKINCLNGRYRKRKKKKKKYKNGTQREEKEKKKKMVMRKK